MQTGRHVAGLLDAAGSPADCSSAPTQSGGRAWAKDRVRGGALFVNLQRIRGLSYACIRDLASARRAARAATPAGSVQG